MISLAELRIEPHYPNFPNKFIVFFQVQQTPSSYKSVRVRRGSIEPCIMFRCMISREQIVFFCTICSTDYSTYDSPKLSPQHPYLCTTENLEMWWIYFTKYDGFTLGICLTFLLHTTLSNKRTKAATKIRGVSGNILSMLECVSSNQIAFDSVYHFAVVPVVEKPWIFNRGLFRNFKNVLPILICP